MKREKTEKENNLSIESRRQENWKKSKQPKSNLPTEFLSKKPKSKQSIIRHKNTERKVANIAEKLQAYQNRVLAQNSHKKFVGVVSESNACHALFSKQKCWHNLPKKPTVCSMKTFLFFQHSIHYILITITQNNKERNNHIISSNVAKTNGAKRIEEKIINAP